MNYPDDLERAIADRQLRYRHQAYHDHLNRHALRRTLGQQLIRLGTSLNGTTSSRPSA